MEVLLFGDQTADQLPLLRVLVRHKHNSILSTFLEQVGSALRNEISKLPWSRRTCMPDFLTVGELVEAYAEQKRVVPELETAFVTISQLGHYFAHCAEHPETLTRLSESRLIGLCTGLLAATAVSSARSLSELIPLAVETVRIAFRTGFQATVAAESIERHRSKDETWATIVTNMSEATAESEIQSFTENSGIDASRSAYVSAVSVMAVTISGPPSTTRQLFESSQAWKNNSRFSIPIYAPFHAKHLLSEDIIDQILDEESQVALSWYKPSAQLFSSSTGSLLEVTDTYKLMRQAIKEILREPVRWDRLLHGAVTDIVSLQNSQCTITSIGITNMTNSLVSALKAGGQSNVQSTDFSSLDTQSAAGGIKARNDKIAIVGMAGRFPDAANHDELWDLLMRGVDAHREIPKDRFDAQAHCDPSGKAKNKSHTPYGCFIEEPGLFDPRFFSMSPREAAQTDPMGRLALVTAYEALEMSGYVANRTPSTKLHRIGTFYGQTSDDWREINAAENIDTYFITGGVRAFGPGRINYYFKFSGPSFSVDTACSSSMAAIQLACTSLWAGDCDTACAGGLNVLTNPDIFAGLSKGQFLSKTGSCKTYDNDADGYCRGDGCGTVILKRYEDAVADNDNILGCILSAATNHSAQAVSITHPHAGAQEFLYKKVLADAGVDAHEVQYVEMHGTGTQAGDGIEMTSVTNVFAPPHRRRLPHQTLHLGAIKANIGHAEAASGINSLIKVLMMMQKNCIPPNVGIKGVMNKSFPSDLKERNVHIPVEAVQMPRNGDERRKIFLNNFSAAGGNTAVLLEDGPLRTRPAVKDPRSHQLITVSARAISSLQKNINNLVEHLRGHPDATLPSLSYTLTARRIQHNYRVAISVSDLGQAEERLSEQIRETYTPVPMVATPVAFSFTGQGSQYTGVAQNLYQTLPSFKAEIDHLDRIGASQNLPSFLPLLDGTEVHTLSPVVVQLGLACIQVALAHMWMSWGIQPVAVIGHSLGEYAALQIAGVISVTDMIRLVGRRAQLLVSACTAFTHAMLAVKAGVDEIEEALSSDMIEIACKNSPVETVLCGTKETVESVNEVLIAKGFRSTTLKVPFAFHSAQVEPILDELRSITSSVSFSSADIPVLSPLKSEVLQDAKCFDAEYFVRHARDTVNFEAALEAGLEKGIVSEKTNWLEIGAHPIGVGLIKATLESATSTSPVALGSLRRNEDPWKTITESICALYNTGSYLNFDEYHRQFNAAHQLLFLPTYQFDNKKYWLDYHNNWCLTKGEEPSAILGAKEVAEVPSKLSTTSCHRIVREKLHANSATVVVRSNLAEPKLAAVVQGHLVNNAGLCPSSLYADQALTIMDYVYNQIRPKAVKPGFNVCNMEVVKPFIAAIPPPPEGQFMEIEANVDLEAGLAQMKYRSVSPQGNLIQEHAKCTVKIEDIESWQEQWSMTNYMVQSQIDSLKRKLATGEAHSVLRGMAYKLFKALVTYDPRYRGMEEVIIDGKDTEAAASISFQTKETDGSFLCSPFWIDSLCHISGFICNGTDLIDSDMNVYVSHGWGSMRFAKSFSAEKKYRSYVRMVPQPNNVRAGTVYIFDGDEIVGVVGGIKFQQIPRRVLNTFLPPAGGKLQPIAQTAVARPPMQKSISFAPTVSKAKKVTPSSSVGETVSKFMTILQAETDVNMSELVDEAAFDNLGVDSLLSLTISARIREEIEIEIPSTLFSDYTTVGALKKYFAQYDTGIVNVPVSSDDSDSGSEIGLGGETPYDECSTSPSSPPSPVFVDEKQASYFDLPSKASVVKASGGSVSLARSIISGEMGMPEDSIADNASLAELGMDSLMSLTILSALREQTGVELPSEFLITNDTIEDIENALGLRAKPKPTKKTVQARSSEQPKGSQSAKSAAINSEGFKIPLKDVSRYPKATSVLLQGSAKTCEKKLFLFPDGSGSATSYVSIPTIDPTTAVFALNCPFMKTPKDFLIGIDGVATIYLNEMKRRQPKGPYILGGWSAGGVIAYEVACQLLALGEEVEKLLLIDSPCPVALEPLPARLHHFFDDIGLLGTGGKGSSPEWLLPHFESSIKALDEYKPRPIPQALVPKTFAIWAREGVCGKPGDPRPPSAEGEDPKPMKWLLENRTDFGDNGWAALLGTKAMSFAQMDGNHFSMMTGDHATTLGKLIKQGLGL